MIYNPDWNIQKCCNFFLDYFIHIVYLQVVKSDTGSLISVLTALYILFSQFFLYNDKSYKLYSSYWQSIYKLLHIYLTK